MDTGIFFRPVSRPDLPTLYVGQDRDGDLGYLYCAIDAADVVQVQTLHASMADALRQVALRMDIDRVNGPVDYEVRVA